MNTLHLTFSIRGLRSCRKRAGHDDVIILLGPAVLAAHENTHPILRDDACLYGLGEHPDLVPRMISYVDLVDLTSRFKPIVSWP